MTLVAGDVKISKNGAAEANHAGTLSELAGGFYYYEFTAGELDTLGFCSFRLVKSGVRTYATAVQVVPFDPYSGIGLGLTALPNEAAGAAGGLPNDTDANGRVRVVNGTADGEIALATGGVDVRNWRGSSIPVQDQPGVPDVNVKRVNDSLAAAQALADSLGGAIQGTIQAGSTSTVLETNLTNSNDDLYKDSWYVQTSGAGIGQRKRITGHDGTGNTLNVEQLEVVPALNDTFVIV